MKMRWILAAALLVIAAVLGVMFSGLLNGPPAPAPSAPRAVAAVTAPAPATAADDPKSALLRFMRAGIGGEEQGVFANTYLADEAAAAEAHALLGVGFAEGKWTAALAAAFKLPDTSSSVARDIEFAAKEIAGAAVSIDGDTAQVVMNPSTTISMRREQGAWKVDFFKTQRAMEGAYDKEVVAAAAARVQIYEGMIAEVKAGKYADEETASAELEKRLAKAPDASPNAEKARRSAALADIANIKTALSIFEVDVGRYPTTEEGLAALLKAPQALSGEWRGPYLAKAPLDKWGHDYIYLMPGTDDPTSYDLSSAGPDGIPGTDDDITKTTKE